MQGFGFDPNVYNSLPSVEQSDRALGKQEVLDALASVIVEYGLADFAGIRLLHRHNEVSAGELMLEVEEFDDDGAECLTTVATHVNGGHRAAARPNSWKVDGGQVVPMEFSADPDVVPNAAESDRLPRFFDALGAALRACRAKHVLGPAVVRRAFFSRHANCSDRVAIETIDEQRRANVVRYDRRERYEGRSLVETTWIVQPLELPEARDRCSTYCAASCVPITACVRSGDRHESRSHHSRNHTKLHGG